MRVLLMVHRFHPDFGGSEITAEILARGWTERYGDQVTVVTHTTEQDPDVHFPFRVVREPSDKELFELVRDADVVFHNNACIQFYKPQLLLRRPWVVTMRAWVVEPDQQLSPAQRAKYALKTALINRADVLLANSRAMAEHLPKVRAVIPNCYRDDVFTLTNQQPRDRRNLVYVGRLFHNKGVDYLLRSVAELVAAGLDPRLTIVGDGPFRDELDQLVAQLGLTDRVHFTGTLTGPETAQVLNDSAVLVMPSRNPETFGNVVIEAAACGVVPVATNAGGAPDAVGRAGILVERGSVASITEAVQALMSDDQVYESYRARLAEHAAKFSVRNMVDRYHAMLEVAVAEHASRNALTRRLPIPAPVAPASVGHRVAGLASDQVVMIVLARNPTGPRTGRIAVLETAVRGLQSGGARVVIYAITGQPGPDEWMGAKVHRVLPPGMPRMAVSVMRKAATGRPFNEAVLESRRVRRLIRAVALKENATVMVADGIRTWKLAQEPGLPVIVHLDDLLSERYGSSEFADSNESVLGYFGQELPGGVRPVAEKSAQAVLGLESRRAAVAERNVARRAAVTAMTSKAEAAVLAERAGRRVEYLPMAVDLREQCDPAQADPRSAVFVGVMHYGPNLAALRHLRDKVQPRLREQGAELTVDVIGDASTIDTAEFDGSGIRFLGYVDDLGQALCGHRMFLSPVLSGTGVKTKVLDAMSVGLPVVATTLGAAGIPLVAGESALIADDPAEFVRHVVALQQDPQLARSVGEAGFKVLRDQMSCEEVYAGWRRALASASSASSSVKE